MLASTYIRFSDITLADDAVRMETYFGTGMFHPKEMFCLCCMRRVENWQKLVSGLFSGVRSQIFCGCCWDRTLDFSIQKNVYGKYFYELCAPDTYRVAPIDDAALTNRGTLLFFATDDHKERLEVVTHEQKLLEKIFANAEKRLDVPIYEVDTDYEMERYIIGDVRDENRGDDGSRMGLVRNLVRRS